MRLNKHIAESGHCSRREADRLIAERRVRVNGVAAGIGTQVADGDEVLVDGQPLRARAVVKASAPAQPAAAPRLTLDAARQHAAAALSGFLQALIAQVDARQIVDADERIAHLSDEEKQLVATLIDEATAVVDCQFNEFEEGADDALPVGQAE